MIQATEYGIEGGYEGCSHILRFVAQRLVASEDYRQSFAPRCKRAKLRLPTSVGLAVLADQGDEECRKAFEILVGLEADA